MAAFQYSIITPGRLDHKHRVHDDHVGTPSPAHHTGYHLAPQLPTCTCIDFSQQNVVPGTQSRRIAFVGVEMQLHPV